MSYGNSRTVLPGVPRNRAPGSRYRATKTKKIFKSVKTAKVIRSKISNKHIVKNTIPPKPSSNVPEKIQANSNVLEKETQQIPEKVQVNSNAFEKVQVNSNAFEKVQVNPSALKKEETRQEIEQRKIDEEELTKHAVKKCLFCDRSTYKDEGCNYMKCSDAEPKLDVKNPCPGEWCWLCYKPKYKEIPEKEHLGCCNDKTHNSH